ncbi:MAG: UDP-glucose 4-epimerase GalE [Candidatus Marinimicrobia bacterium]|nr:UDP-glucose 4-epimerase GalE [Candidatus Neomarinimicrobiota bacterium]
MKILVTGGAGYVGSHAVIDFCDAGHDVTVYDDLSLGMTDNIDIRATFVEGSTHDISLLRDVLSQGFEAVVHFAAWKAAGESMVDPKKYSHNNMNGTLNILNIMMDLNIKYFIFSSTAAVYGFPEYLPIDEDHPVNPINYYGYTKLAIEQNLKWFSDLQGLRYAALRYFNAAGYDVKGRIRGKERNPQNLLPVVMEVASGIRNSLKIFGDDYKTHDGTGVRDYIHVNDLATAHIKALDYLVDNDKDIVLNLASGEGFSVLDVINETEKVSGNAVPYEIEGRREGDPAELVSISKLAWAHLKWKPVFSDLNTLITSTWNVYKP